MPTFAKAYKCLPFFSVCGPPETSRCIGVCPGNIEILSERALAFLVFDLLF